MVVELEHLPALVAEKRPTSTDASGAREVLEDMILAALQLVS